MACRTIDRQYKDHANFIQYPFFYIFSENDPNWPIADFHHYFDIRRHRALRLDASGAIRYKANVAIGAKITIEELFQRMRSHCLWFAFIHCELVFALIPCSFFFKKKFGASLSN